MSRAKRILMVLVGGAFLALLLPRWLSPGERADAVALCAGFLALVLLLHCARPLTAGELCLLAALCLPGLVGVGQRFGALAEGPALALAVKCLLCLFFGWYGWALAGMLLPRGSWFLAPPALSLGAAVFFALVAAPAGWVVAAAPPLLSAALCHYLRRLRNRDRA